MVAATINKRGRPKSSVGEEAEIFNEYEPRKAINTTYTGLFCTSCGYGCNSFFVNQRGNFRHNGISQQLGRMLFEGVIDIDGAKKLAEQCIADYNSGESVKQIEKRLRYIRLCAKSK